MSVYPFLYQEELYRPAGSIMIVMDEPWNDLREEDKTLLSKILGSVKISLEGVQVLHARHTQVESLKLYGASKVIAFGATVKECTSLYVCQTVGSVSVITSEALHVLDDGKKKSLWGALRQMFA
jgi:hypothetical protein